MLCRVILGTVELVHPGSRQSCPSSSNFDSGVDDLQNPQYYIVWNMNMNTHIFPEFVISFKIRASTGGDLLLRKFLISSIDIELLCCFFSILGNVFLVLIHIFMLKKFINAMGLFVSGL